MITQKPRFGGVFHGRIAKSGPRRARWRTTRAEVAVKTLRLLCVPLVLAACQQVPRVEPPTSAAPSQGQAFAQMSCAECHAIGPTGRSPRSEAPAFPVIVNKEGLTAETLSFWLRGAHNYPREMDFYLGEREVDALVAYMLTLKDPNFRRPPD